MASQSPIAEARRRKDTAIGQQQDGRVAMTKGHHSVRSVGRISNPMVEYKRSDEKRVHGEYNKKNII